jgi:hypothetical protein
VSRGKQVFIAAEEFPNQPLCAIAKDGISRLFCDGDSQASDPIRVAAGYDGKEPRTSSDPLFINNPIAALAGDLFCPAVRLCFHDGQTNIPADAKVTILIPLSSFCPWLAGGSKPACRFSMPCGQENHGISFSWYSIYWSMSFSCLNPSK